eukprot:TRINITY_DN4371_c0_g1_i1.p1 TRINITY_DN4371_c0_g1~~TRINITY_DN4371_c0_g1_i1.p1  ORF type:complete len:153 (+),score=24.28 TRINITY_DN4371_c0_g1_i1:60-461(+)
MCIRDRVSTQSTWGSSSEIASSIENWRKRIKKIVIKYVNKLNKDIARPGDKSYLLSRCGACAKRVSLDSEQIVCQVCRCVIFCSSKCHQESEIHKSICETLKKNQMLYQAVTFEDKQARILEIHMWLTKLNRI